MPSLDALKSFYFEDDESQDAALNSKFQESLLPLIHDSITVRTMSKKILTVLQDKSQYEKIAQSEKAPSLSALNLDKPLPPLTKQQPSMPVPKLPFRTWTDLSGSFKVEARFLSVSGNMVTLERAAGDQMGIMMDKMSSADLDYILGLQQQGIDVRKAPTATVTKMPSNHKLSGSNADKPPTPSMAPTSGSDVSRNSTTTAAKSSLPPGFIIPSTALKIDLTPNGKLGAGTSGFVRRATYAGNNVAVKIISVRHLTKPQREAVIKEAEIMSRIVHPNAVRLFGVMIEEGLGLGLVMELLPLGCLKTYIETAPVPSLAQRVRIARDVSHAMGYLHDTLNMVHRDLKALNVLLDDSGVFLRAKVCDFGFAHVKSLGMDSTFWTGPPGSASSSPTGTSEFSGGAIRGLKMQAAISIGSMTVNGGMGTPLWMAPELFDMNALISKPGDVFAFTIVMTEIFSWAGPYCIAYEAIIPIMQNVIALVQSGRRPELALTADVPLSIRSLIEAGWDHNPEKRPTFRDMTRVLEKAKAEADYNSIYATSQVPMPPSPLVVRDTRMDGFPNTPNNGAPSTPVTPAPGSQPLDNMIGLQRSLPPQASPTSASAPMLNIQFQQYQYNNGNTQQQQIYNPFRDPNQQSQTPSPSMATGRVGSQSGSIPTLNMLNGNINNNFAKLGTSSLSNLQQQQQQLPPPLPQPTQLRPPTDSNSALTRPHSLPPAEFLLPGSKHA
ncbi:UNVERIFIED_CONTAM: hypothetical protein HDU68_001602, partial [Siphonaria sp. JEL0065]